MGKKLYPYVRGNEWVYPHMAGHKMACCDCCLIHSIQFEIVRLKNPEKKFGDPDEDEIITDPDLRVRMRVDRDNRATGQLRRHQNIKVRQLD